MKDTQIFVLLLVLGASLLFFGCVGGQDSTTKNVTKQVSYDDALDQFKSKDSNYTYYSSPMFLIYYPKGWQADDSKNPVFEFLSPLEDDSDKMQDGFAVEIWAGNESTAAEFEAYEQKLMLKGDVVTSKGNIIYKGRDAFFMEVESKSPKFGIPMFYKTVFFRNGKWVYRLNYGFEKSKSGKYKQTMESILERFVIGSG